MLHQAVPHAKRRLRDSTSELSRQEYKWAGYILIYLYISCILVKKNPPARGGEPENSEYVTGEELGDSERATRRCGRCGSGSGHLTCVATRLPVLDPI